MGNLQGSEQDLENEPLAKQFLDAAQRGDEERLCYLLKQDEIVEINDGPKAAFLSTLLFVAAKQGNPECLEVLLQAGGYLDS